MISAEWCISQWVHPTQLRPHLNAGEISLRWGDFSPCKVFARLSQLDRIFDLVRLRVFLYLLLEKVQKEGRGVATFLLLYSPITFTACVGKVRFPLLLFGSSFKILIQTFIVLKHGIICTFLIHSGSLQKMLTALFNSV